MHRADAVQTRPGGNRRDINAINIYWHPCNCGFMARTTLLLCTLWAVHFKRWENETAAAAGLWLGLSITTYLTSITISLYLLYKTSISWVHFNRWGNARRSSTASQSSWGPLQVSILPIFSGPVTRVAMWSSRFNCTLHSCTFKRCTEMYCTCTFLYYWCLQLCIKTKYMEG